ncbi:transposase [Streptomyces sp. NPDC007205]|uniref:IS110 family transposase n=1 Tax=Streptomyces sp. NPDC007205 TaxID=3154316 RepID=UPI003409AEAF
MTEQTHPRHDTADQHEQVLVGVDTHKDVHVAAVITSTGALLDTQGFPTTREGYRQLLSWARSFGQLQQAGVECTGSYGAALTRYLHHEGITVTEVNQPDKAARRRHGKSDDIDAAAAARAVLSGPALGHPHPLLRGTTGQRGQDTTRSHPMPQTLRRPRDLPSPAHNAEPISRTSLHWLTSIGASSAVTSSSAPPPQPPSSSGSEHGRPNKS